MVVQISLANSFEMKGVQKICKDRNDSCFRNGNCKIYNMCSRFIGPIDNIAACDELDSSKKLHHGINECLISLPIQQREIGVILVNQQNNYNNTTLAVWGPVLEMVTARYPGISMKLRVNLTSRQNGSVAFISKLSIDLSADVSSNDGLKSMLISEPDLWGGNYEIRKTLYYVKQDLDLYANLQQPYSYSIKFELLLSIPNGEELAQLDFLTTLRNTTDFKLFGNLLAKDDHSDLVIVASDGQEFKCQKCFLTVHSEVFTSMFSKEGNSPVSHTDRIEMEKMSGDGVKSLLEYLYTFSTTAADKCPQTALSLLQACHEYKIKSLEDCMKSLFLSWPAEWENSNIIEVALRLFAFVRTVEGMEDLKKKSFEILSCRSQELLESQYYKDLFLKDVPAAMELCAFAVGQLSTK